VIYTEINPGPIMCKDREENKKDAIELYKNDICQYNYKVMCFWNF
jgi:hypothetical protein